MIILSEVAVRTAALFFVCAAGNINLRNGLTIILNLIYCLKCGYNI